MDFKAHTAQIIRAFLIIQGEKTTELTDGLGTSGGNEILRSRKNANNRKKRAKSKERRGGDEMKEHLVSFLRET